MDWLRLTATAGVTPAVLEALLEHFGSARAILEAGRAALQQAGLDQATIEALQQPPSELLDATRDWLQASSRHHLIDWGDPAYPALLREIPRPPRTLFLIGDTTGLQLPQIAIVGSRNPTAEGRENAYRFARHLAESGFTVTSGLALGVDGAAHQGALDGHGRTLAVLGTGVDRIYPRQHRDLAHAIVDQGGALISEYPLGTPPQRPLFPQRNRLISGLALGTLVVEASQNSGSLSTARHAMQQGREVFAIPGSIHSPLSRGCHQLIRAGAKLVESSRDIVDELGPMTSLLQQSLLEDEPSPPPAAELDDEYQNLLQAMEYAPVDIDTLVERTGLTAENVSSMLLILELNGHVIASPGGLYSRTHHAP